MKLRADSLIARSLCAVAVFVPVACASRTGLDMNNGDPISLGDFDAGADVAIEEVSASDAITTREVTVDDAPVTIVDAAPEPDVVVPPRPDAAVDVPTIPDAVVIPPTPDARPDAIDIFDVFPIPESGPIADCANCVKDHCASQVNACVNDPACAKGLGCTVTTCLGGGGGGGAGGIDFACVLGCFGGDFSAAGVAIGAFTCVTGSCASTCTGGAGIPGIPGAPGGGGSAAASESSGASAMSAGVPWSADQVRALDPTTRFPIQSDAFDAWQPQLEAARICAAHPAK